MIVLVFYIVYPCQANSLELSRQADKFKAKRAKTLRLQQRKLKMNAVATLYKRIESRMGSNVLQAFWTWKCNANVVAAHAAQAQAEELRERNERDATAEHKRGCLRLLDRWASSVRLSDMSRSFSLWKHAGQMQALAAARETEDAKHSAQMRTVVALHERHKKTRARQVASRTFQCIVERVSHSTLERAWGKWRAFTGRWMSIGRLRSLYQNKIVLLKRKWVRISNEKMQRNLQKLKRKMTLENKQNLTLQTLLLRRKSKTFRIHVIGRHFRRWHRYAQLESVSLRSLSFERSSEVLSAMVSRLRDGLRCRQILSSWQGFVQSAKLRKRDALHTRVLLQSEDKMSLLRSQLSGMENKLDTMQCTLIDRQAQNVSESREADIKMAVSILGSLIVCRSRYIHETVTFSLYFFVLKITPIDMRYCAVVCQVVALSAV